MKTLDALVWIYLLACSVHYSLSVATCKQHNIMLCHLAVNIPVSFINYIRPTITSRFYHTAGVNRFFMKLFCTKDISVVTCCQEMFRVELPSEIIKKRLVKF